MHAHPLRSCHCPVHRHVRLARRSGWPAVAVPARRGALCRTDVTICFARAEVDGGMPVLCHRAGRLRRTDRRQLSGGTGIFPHCARSAGAHAGGAAQARRDYLGAGPRHCPCAGRRDTRRRRPAAASAAPGRVEHRAEQWEASNAVGVPPARAPCPARRRRRPAAPVAAREGVARCSARRRGAAAVGGGRTAQRRVMTSE